MVQLRAPVAARGRILSIYMMALGLVYPLGAVIQGWLADTHGVRAVTVAGAVALLALATLTAGVRPSIFTNLGDPIADPVTRPPVDGRRHRRRPSATHDDGPADGRPASAPGGAA